MSKLFFLVALFSQIVSANVPTEIKPSQLVGVWRLLKSENYMGSGKIVSYCNGVHGYVIYTADGFVSVSLNCGQKTNAPEPADISGRKFFYTGQYKVKGSTVSHYIENASDVGLIGSTSVRSAKLYGPTLVLSGENQGQEFSATWEYVNAGLLP